jgi:hypothetical protein
LALRSFVVALQHEATAAAAPPLAALETVVVRILLTVCFGLIATVAGAEVRILSSSGGEVSGYLNFFEHLKHSGERVVIDGPCFSACTLVLSTIPRSRICVTSRAVLGFHAPQLVDQVGRRYASPQATRAVAATYPPAIRAWIQRHGGLRQTPIFLRGRQLAAIYPRC